MMINKNNAHQAMFIYILTYAAIAATNTYYIVVTTFENPKIISMEKKSFSRENGTYRVIDSKDYERIGN